MSWGEALKYVIQEELVCMVCGAGDELAGQNNL